MAKVSQQQQFFKFQQSSAEQLRASFDLCWRTGAWIMQAPEFACGWDRACCLGAELMPALALAAVTAAALWGW